MTETTYTWWNKLPLSFDGTLFSIGSFDLRYYGLMYIFAFVTGFLLMKYFNKKEKLGYSKEQLEGLLTAVILGIVIGARLGYVVFYNLPYYLSHPLEIIMPFRFQGGFRFTGISGMSYHGGLIGAALGGIIYIRKHKLPFWQTVNLGFTAAPLAYTWGRIGNFLNSELYGRITDAPIGMLFNTDSSGLLRHPSQLYEAFFEGVVLFGIIVLLRKVKAVKEHIISVYIFGYGFFRFFIEYFRQPDDHIGLGFLGLSRGQMLCIAMMLAAAALWLVRFLKEKKDAQVQKK